MDLRANILSLASGGLGLDLGIELAVETACVVCAVECEAFACAYLAACVEGGVLAPFPVWTDVRTFDGKPWRGLVDCISAGYPCQPFSCSGKRRGADDERHLWPDISRIIREVGPNVVFIENVANHLRLGGCEVIRELHAMGYRTAAGLFSAYEVGASHERERLFILAVADHLERPMLAVAGCEHDGRGGQGCDLDSGDEADALGEESADGPDYVCEVVDDGLPAFPPAPDAVDQWERICAEHPHRQPSVRRVAHGLAGDSKNWRRLHGNGVCPLAAAHAFTTLWTDLWGGGSKPTTLEAAAAPLFYAPPPPQENPVPDVLPEHLARPQH